MSGVHPDKRSVAYEQIFGRPTAKPKGPQAFPPNGGGPIAYQAPLQQYAPQPHPQSWAAGPSHVAQPRWTGGSVSNGGLPPVPYGRTQPPYQDAYAANNGYAPDPIDRRTSVTPSLASHMSLEPRAASIHQPPPHQADPYGQTPAASYASYYQRGSVSDFNAPGEYSGYTNPNAPSPPGQGRHSIPYAPPDRSVYDVSPVGALPPSTNDASPSLTDANEPSPVYQDPPRLPSIELGRNDSAAEDPWFTPAAAVASGATSASEGRSRQNSGPLADQGRSGPASPVTPLQQLRDSGDVGSGADAYTSEYAPGLTSSASSIYETGRRRGSFESDQQSIVNSIYGGLNGGGGGSSRMYTSTNPSSSGYFPPPGSSNYPQNGALQDRQHYPQYQPQPLPQPPKVTSRTRTTSSSTQVYPPSTYAQSNAEWRKSSDSTRLFGGPNRFEQRAMSMGQTSIGPGPGAITPISPHGSVTGGAIPTATTRRGPVVYPALLSRVADAFKTRVNVAERAKDGLTYADAFDGREAVDKIAYIIKTTDRNLALLLGRALDAQKFFHDVTYDHRLRDSPNELYQFRVRLAGPPFEVDIEEDRFHDAKDTFDQNHLPLPPASSAASLYDDVTPGAASSSGPTPLTGGKGDEDDALPTGVFTLLTDCYSPTCTRDRLCYSIACPRRLEQQARLNMMPQPGLKRSISKESLEGEVKEPGMLWSDTVDKAIFEATSETERKRQEAINEVMYTERDFVRDLEYLRDAWIKPLQTRDIVPEAKREDFVTQVFWNVLEIHTVNARLAELLSKRQKQQAVVDRIGDILLEIVPLFSPFVKYGAHQLYGKYEFEKEKASNPAFLRFVEETERLPESRKLELNGYLTKPTTRLARYPLLLEQVVKYTADDNLDKQVLPKVIKIVKEFLSKVNVETGKSENRFNLAQLDQQLVFKQGEAVDLRLRDEQRELVFKGPLKRRGGTQSESAELQVFLFDHALLMVKAKTVQKNALYKVYRKPIPLELLTVTIYDEVPNGTGKGSASRPKSITSKTSTGNRLSSGLPGAPPKQDAKTGYALTFTHLGRKSYTMTLWASTHVSRRKWFEHIEARQEILRQRSNIFDTITLSEGFFVGTNKINCSVPFDFGRRIIYGTDDGVYLSDLREEAREKKRPPTKVLPLPGVTQVDVLEEHQILIVLAERSLHTFTLYALDPSDPMGSLKRGRCIWEHASFFRAGVCLGRTLVCAVKSTSLSSTIRTLEPVAAPVRGKKHTPIRRLLQGGQDSLRVFKEFYIPTESSSIHFLKNKLCVGCPKGFEIVDLETLDTQGLLDPADSSLDFVHRKETVKPIAIFRIDGEFLLCYDDFAFYVNKVGWRSKGNWMIHWEGSPVSFALHYPYVLAFEPSFIEVRHVRTGALHQVITGYNLRCLFADVPSQLPASGSSSASSSSLSVSSHSSHSMHPGYGRPAQPNQFGGYPGIQRQPSINNMLGGPRPQGYPPNSHQARAGPYGGPTSQQMMYPTQGMPYAFTQAQAPPPPPVQRNPVWESVAASRNQIVFIGDQTVFCVRLAEREAGDHSGSSTALVSNGR